MSGRQLTALAAVSAVALAVACSHQSSPVSPTGVGGGSTAAAAAADGSTLKTTKPVAISPVGDAQLTDAPTLTASAATLKNGGSVTLLYHFEVFNDANAKVVDSGLVSGPSYKVTAQLDFKKRFTWHVRAEADGGLGPWSDFASFLSPEGGYIRGSEVFDPLTNGVTVGQVNGHATFLANVGIRIDDTNSFVKYPIPTTITSGQFTVEVMNLKPNAPGGKLKVMSMSSAYPDFTTDPYRYDIQYRGNTGSPPNAITFRALYGSADDTSVRYEPDTTTRNNSVFNLNPNTWYLWKVTWGAEARVQVYEGGAGGKLIYNIGVKSSKGSYNPQPQFAYLGAPPQRSGEDASIPGTIYRNAWFSNRDKPF